MFSAGSVWKPLDQRRPLVGITLVFMAGILAGNALIVPFHALISGSALCVVLSVVARRRTILSLLFLYSAILLLGWSCFKAEDHTSATASLLVEGDASRTSARIIGMVASDPVASYTTKGASHAVRFVLRVQAINQFGTFVRSTGHLDVFWKGGQTHKIMYGDRWDLRGVVAPSSWGDDLSLYVIEEDAQFLSRGHGNAVMRWCTMGRRKAFELLGAGIHDFPDQAGIVRALLLGYKRELPSRLQKIFSETGTLHIFAISGLHVGVVCILLVGLLRSAGVHRPYWIAFLAPLLVAYTMATGWRPSAIRACIMALAYFTSFLFQRRPDPLSAVAVAALLILIAAPTQLFDAGFIYSFTIVTLLIVVCPNVYRSFATWSKRDAWRLEKDSRMAALRRRLALWLGGLVITSCVAWIASAPLTALYFNHVSISGLVGNVLVIPASFLIVLTGCLSLCLGCVHIGLAEIFNYANVAFIAGLVAVIEQMGDMPFAHFSVKAPSWTTVAAWYGTLLGAVAIRHEYRIWVLVVACMGVGLGWGVASQQRDVTARVMPVHDGHVMLIELPGEDPVLVDVGPEMSAGTLLSMLKRRGVNRLSTLILTDTHASRTGGLKTLLADVHVGEMWLPRGVDDPWALVPGSEHVPRRELEAGAAGYWPGGVSWEYVYVHGRGSVTLRVANRSHAVLYAGCAKGAHERAMLDDTVDLAATTLVVGHSVVSPEACSDAWLREVRPERAMISSVGHATFTVSERLAFHGIERLVPSVEAPALITL